MWGVQGRALSHPRLPPLWAGCRSPLPTGCGCGKASAWGPVTNPTARAPASRLCALWGRHEGACGGRLLPGCGASGVGRSPNPDCPPFGRAAGLLCLCVPCLAGSGGLASRARFGAPHLSFGLSCSAPGLFGPLRAGVALFVVVIGFFFFLLLCPFSPSLRPRLSSFACFPAAGALGLGVFPPPPPFFFPPPPLCAPLSPALRVSRPGVPWALASRCPPPPPPLPFFFVSFDSPPLCCLWRFLLSGCLWPPRPPPFFFFFFLVLLLFFPAACLLCVFWGVVLCVPCPACSLCCARRLCCFWWLVLLVPGVAAFCWGSAGGCPALSFGGVCRLWCPCLIWPSLSVLPVVSRSPVLCPVALCCRVVLCCGALSSSFFVFLPAVGAGFLLFPVGSGLRAGSGSFLFLCSACAVLCWCACAVALCLVLSCPRGAGWCFVLLPVAPVCLLLGLAVPCCLLVGPGGSWCRVSVACCGVSLGAVLRRVAARCAAWRCVVVRCVVSFCSVWCCRALCCVPGRCPSSWGLVPSGAVFCLVPPRCVCFAVVCRCVVLFAVVPCAVCALGCRVVRLLSSPPCAVILCGPLSLVALLPCAVPRGAVLPRGAVVSCPAALLGFVSFVGVVVPT